MGRWRWFKVKDKHVWACSNADDPGDEASWKDQGEAPAMLALLGKSVTAWEMRLCTACGDVAPAVESKSGKVVCVCDRCHGEIWRTLQGLGEEAAAAKAPLQVPHPGFASDPAPEPRPVPRVVVPEGRPAGGSKDSPKELKEPPKEPPPTWRSLLGGKKR